jgi:hypothetical protein
MDRAEVLDLLERDGILLLSDPALPSLVSLVAGSPLHRSWWGHPMGGEIHRLHNELADHSAVVSIKLVSGKVTFVHRRLWPYVAAIGAAREAWQLEGLSEAARLLLADLDASGRLGWDDLPPFLPPGATRARDVVRALDERLLVHADEVHTPSGAHARELETWAAWAERVGLAQPWPSAAAGRVELECIVDSLNARCGGRGRLPWTRKER